MATGDDRPLDVLVLGAGSTGLAFAWRAVAEGRRVLVLEAADRPGGSFRTHVRDGYVVEEGDALVLGAAPHLERLLSGVEGAPPLVPSEPVPLRPPRAGRSGLASWADRVGVGARALRARPSAAGATLERFAEGAVGARLRRDAVDPLARFLWGVPAAALGAADAWPELVAGPEKAWAAGRHLLATLRSACRARLLEGGVETLLLRMAEKLGPRLSLSERALSLEPAREGTPARVSTAAGRVLTARTVALALPAAEQARLLRPFAPHWSEALQPERPVSRVAVFLSATRVPGTSGTSCGALARPGALDPFAGWVDHARLDATRAPPGRSLLEVRLAPWGGRPLPDLPDLSWERIAKAALDRWAPEMRDTRPLTVLRDASGASLPLAGPRARRARAAADLASKGVRLLGDHGTGSSPEARSRVASPVAGSLPSGASLAS